MSFHPVCCTSNTLWEVQEAFLPLSKWNAVFPSTLSGALCRFFSKRCYVLSDNNYHNVKSPGDLKSSFEAAVMIIWIFLNRSWIWYTLAWRLFLQTLCILTVGWVLFLSALDILEVQAMKGFHIEEKGKNRKICCFHVTARLLQVYSSVAAGLIRSEGNFKMKTGPKRQAQN